MTAPRAEMRLQYETVLDDWVTPCQVFRFISITDLTGRPSGTFQSVKVDEPVWIQPLSRGSDSVETPGTINDTSHWLFQYWDGFQLLPKDKIYWTDESGQSREFDVVRAHLKESHRIAELMEVRRNPT